MLSVLPPPLPVSDWLGLGLRLALVSGLVRVEVSATCTTLSQTGTEGDQTESEEKEFWHLQSRTQCSQFDQKSTTFHRSAERCRGLPDWFWQQFCCTAPHAGSELHIVTKRFHC